MKTSKAIQKARAKLKQRIEKMGVDYFRIPAYFLAKTNGMKGGRK